MRKEGSSPRLPEGSADGQITEFNCSRRCHQGNGDGCACGKDNVKTIGHQCPVIPEKGQFIHIVEMAEL